LEAILRRSLRKVKKAERLKYFLGDRKRNHLGKQRSRSRHFREMKEGTSNVYYSPVGPKKRKDPNKKETITGKEIRGS